MRRALLAALAALAAPLAAAAPPDDADRLPPIVAAQLRSQQPWIALSLADARAAQEDLSAAERVVALRQAGEIRLRLGDVPGAERDFALALALAPKDAETLLDLAEAARGRPADALVYALKAASAAASARRRGAAYRAAGEIRLDLGDAAGARRDLAKALELRPEDLDALRAMVRARRGAPAEAETFARRSSEAAASAPAWLRAAAWRMSARAWLDLGGKPEAARCLTEALRSEPDDLDALESLRDLVKAGVAASTASFSASTSAAPPPSPREDPEDLPALSAAITAALDAPNADQARNLVDRFTDAVAKAPSWQRVSGYRECARLWTALDDGEAALQCARAARDLDTLSPATHRLVRDLGERREDVLPSLLAGYVAAARLKAELGDDAGASQSFERALDAAPRDAAVLDAYFELELAKDPRAAALLAERLIEAAQDLGPAAQAAAYRRKAQALRAAHDDAGAEAALERALAVLPGDAASRQAASELALARRDEVAVAAGRAADLRSRAQELRSKGDEEGARSALSRALEISPADPETLEAAFELALSTGDARGADAFADRLVEAERPAAADVRAAGLRRKAQARRALGDAAGARRALERALALAPAEPTVLEASFDLEAASGRPAAAADLAARLVAAVEKAPAAARAAAYRRLASARLALRDAAGARAALERALALAPSDPAALRAALDWGAFDPAAQAALADRLVEASAKAEPSILAAAYRRRAGLSLSRGDEARALEDLERALALAPGEPDDLWTLVYLGRKEPARALALLARPEPAGALMAARSMALRLAGKVPEADRELAAALASGGDPVCARGLFRTRRERLDLAYLDACARRSPKDADLLNDRGVARYLSGDLRGAAEDFRRVVSLRPKDAAARASLATVLEDQARRERR